MNEPTRYRNLRLWPGVAIVALQLLAVFAPTAVDVENTTLFFLMMGSLTIGTLLFVVWWLFFSRARWMDRLGGLGLLIGAYVIAMMLADKSAKLSMMLPGIPLLLAVFVASLFFGRRSVTVAAVLVASLGWTLVRTDGVTGSMESEYSWRWSPTAEERFLASEASEYDPSVVVALNEELGGEPAAWPGFRGRGRDGVVENTSIGTSWESDPPVAIWRRPVGPGWGSFALVGSRLCTQEQREEDEVVVCYGAATGRPIWLHAYPARFWESMAGAGPRATPTYHDEVLYALGATGILNALQAVTGEPIWTRDIREDSGASVPDWGFASSPLVIDDLGLAVVHASGAPEGRSVVAYDLATGEPRWFGEASGASYSSPHLATIDGVRQIVMLTGDGAFGLAPETGELLWDHAWPMGGDGSRIVQPAILDGSDDILIGTSFGLGTRRISATTDGSGAWTVDEVWTSRGLKPYYNDLVVHRGHAYGFDGNILAAIDLQTGDRAWKGGRYGNGQLLLLPEQDLLVVLSEEGELVLVRASPDGHREIARIQAIEGKTWNHPVLAGGVIYVRNGEEAAAYRLPE